MPAQISPLEALDRWRASRQTFIYKGNSIAFWTAGQGPSLVLIHGFPTAAFDFWKIWDELAQRFQVIAADMLGFGMSDKPPEGGYLLKDQASLQEALCAHLNVTHAHVLAHDYGVSVAQELLARQDEGAASLTLKSVVFLNGGLFPEMHRATAGQLALVSEAGPALSAQMSRATFGAAMPAMFGPETQPDPEELDAFWSLISMQDGQTLWWKVLDYMSQRREHGARWTGVLTKAIVPQRLINGPEDPVSGRHAADHYRAHVRDADVVLLDGVGHWPQSEAPAGTLDAFMNFHDRLERGLN